MAKCDMELIENTVNVTIQKINKITVLDRMKVLKDETFKNTEKLLYNFNTLREHVYNEDSYFEMMNKRSSGSIVRYSKTKAVPNDDEMMKFRRESLERSRSDLERVEKALKEVRGWKEYEVLQLRYFQKKPEGDTYTFGEIAELLEKDEKTIRIWKNKIVNEIAIYLFGSDAI